MKRPYYRLITINHPHPPYDIYGSATVYVRDGLQGRRVVRFKKLRNGVDNPLSLPKSMTYARYVFQSEYWKKYGKLIPEGYEVDHINDDHTDDRIENLQMLPRAENMWKRDSKKYGHLKIKQHHIEAIKQYLAVGMSWSEIMQKTKLAPDLLRYIMVHKVDGYNFELNAEMNLTDIRRMILAGKSGTEIGLHFGVSNGTMRRIIIKHLPEYSKFKSGQNIESRHNEIKKRLDEGQLNLYRIAEEVGYTPLNVRHVIKTKFPEYWDKIQELYRAEGDRVFSSGTNSNQKLTPDVLKEFFDKGIRNYSEIAHELGFTNSAVLMATRKHFPEIAQEVADIKNGGDKDSVKRLTAAIAKHGDAVPFNMLFDEAGISRTTGSRLLDTYFTEWKSSRARIPRRLAA